MVVDGLEKVVATQIIKIEGLGFVMGGEVIMVSTRGSVIWQGEVRARKKRQWCGREGDEIGGRLRCAGG